jgi:D-alanyl-D-alanine carboxypeptidase/D-alanyl-D-alanine-endopeptidase (penicillin-binding protein 4)
LKRLRILFSLTLFLQAQLAFSDALSDKINALIKKELPHATVGVVVKDAQTGTIIYSKNADKLLSPASSIKLFTTAAALYQLKPDFRFVTSLSKKGKDYYLTFSGSPSLTDKNLSDLILTLKKNKPNSIEGNIVIDTQQFKPPYYPGGVSYDDLGWYYAAPTTAAIVNENALAYEFTTAKELGMPVQIKAKTPGKGLTIINQLITVSKEDAKHHCDMNIKLKQHNTVHFYGCMAQSKDPKIMVLAIPDPELYVEQVIKETLVKNGMLLKGIIHNGSTPKDAQLIAQFQSADLHKMIDHMLKESDNLYANSLTKELGLAVTDHGSHKQGMYAIKKILAEHTSIDMKQVELADGMGTRYNLSSPKQMVSLLSDLYNDKNLRPIILEALPLAGVSGTLKTRMLKTPLEKRVVAKTGTMHDITSLSGYLLSPQDKTLIFSIIINGVNQPIAKAKKLEEQILMAVDEQSQVSTSS